MSCLHRVIINWGTPQAHCDSCGVSFDWNNEDVAFAAAVVALEARRDALDKAIACLKDLRNWRPAHAAAGQPGSAADSTVANEGSNPSGPASQVSRSGDA